MEVSVESLFQHIKQSEIEAQNRKSLLKEIKQNIYTVQEKLKAGEKEFTELQQDLKEQLQDLGRHENQVKADSIQLEVYIQEKTDLDQELQKLNVQKEDLAEKLRCQQTAQCSELENFALPGWTDKGREIHEKKEQEKFREITEEEERLKSVVQQYKENAQLLVHKEKLQQEYNQAQKEIDEMEANLMVEIEKSEKMIRDQELTQARLDEELNSIQGDVLKEKKNAFDLREKCCDLQKELQSLQQKKWQRNVQRRQNIQTAEISRKEDDFDPEFSDNEDFSEMCDTVEENIVNADQTGTAELPTTHKNMFRSKKH